VSFGLVATLALAKAAKISPRLGSLAAASTAICGITATVAVAPAIDADDQEVAYTVANARRGHIGCDRAIGLQPVRDASLPRSVDACIRVPCKGDGGGRL
jgi:hypothetical protein